MEILKVKPDETFSNFTLVDPSVTAIHGYYFTKLLNKSKPIYVELPLCKVKQSIARSAKKMYCELVIDSELDKWIFNLEKKCKQLLIEKSSFWFENSLKASDMDTVFVPSVKNTAAINSFKLNIKVSILTGQPEVKIFHEEHTSKDEKLSLDILNQQLQNPVKCIIEIQGIKFSEKNFQIEYEVKQILICAAEPPTVEEDIFDTCLIQLEKTNNTKIRLNLTTDLHDPKLNNICDEILSTSNNSIVDEPFEIDLNTLEATDQNISIKDPLEVYRELYKAAVENAKKAKETAKVAWFNAKNIKNTYLANDTSELEEIGDEFHL
jgi:hypothetical protein